ncbi:hypothetical protein BOW53_11485 [Solemya pervernicosa gill symbiont]|uniref:BioF2-like acetyltransferase domain-containing protein n=1 Tax=Solemya pervernicosa gill symbiont TaxID=642797 RepID=A0A1T2L2W9_9GAMM|nr:hypothetical protein BOW53_11485 [Solemya pervernicosa gill symbiont]
MWPQIHHFYASTFHEKGGIPTLNEAFFREVGRGLGRKMVVILAIRSGKIIAGAICFRSDDTLYGRHWGTLENHHSLHFETCLYQGIDYCIQHDLKRFEPGAQGEHKVARGFEPTETLSAHWIADPQFREMIDRYLQQERARGVAIFAEACFGRPSPSKRQILNATVYAYGAPSISTTCVIACRLSNIAGANHRAHWRVVQRRNR